MNQNITSLCAICKKLTNKKCSACKLVYYCCLQHQKSDWSEHKNNCRPYQICQNEVLGRYIQATRDLKPGDVIIQEEPLIFGPRPEKIQCGPMLCVGCCQVIEVESLSYCPACFWPACTSNCPGLTDKTKHGLECAILKTCQFYPQSQEIYEFFRFDVLIALRALLLRKTPSKWRLLLKSEAHSEHRGPGTQTYDIIKEKVNFLTSTFVTGVDAMLIQKIYAILDVNATEISRQGERIKAFALYPLTSILEHSCTPNTRQIISDSHRMCVRAALPIGKNENITSTYTHVLWGNHQRRQHLLETKYFRCSCPRCLDPTEFGTFLDAVNCFACKGGVQVPQNDYWSCDCGAITPRKDVVETIDNLGEELHEMLRKQPVDVANLECLLEKMLYFLHPCHYHVYQLKHTLVQLWNSGNPNKITVCQDLIGITRKIDPGNSRLSLYLAVLILELFNVKFETLETSDPGEIFGYLEEAKKVLEFEILDREGPGWKLYQVILVKEKQLLQTVKQ